MRFERPYCSWVCSYSKCLPALLQPSRQFCFNIRAEDLLLIPFCIATSQIATTKPSTTRGWRWGQFKATLHSYTSFILYLCFCFCCFLYLSTPTYLPAFLLHSFYANRSTTQLSCNNLYNNVVLFLRLSASCLVSNSLLVSYTTPRRYQLGTDCAAARGPSDARFWFDCL